jgi:3-deoxy-7-phosphoheptulonate synthase
MEDYPVSQTAINTITAGRLGADAIVKGQDDRLLVIVGPCSIHDTKAGLEYGMYIILSHHTFAVNLLNLLFFFLKKKKS